MSVELIRFKRGNVGVYGKHGGVKSEWLADVAAAHHIIVRERLAILAKIGATAAKSEIASHEGGPHEDGDHRFSIYQKTEDLDEFIWLTTDVVTSHGRGSVKRNESAEKRARGALFAYEFGFSQKGKRVWSGVGPLRAAISAIYTAGGTL